MAKAKAQAEQKSAAKKVVATSMRLPQELKDQIANAAKKMGTSQASLVNMAVRAHLCPAAHTPPVYGATPEFEAWVEANIGRKVTLVVAFPQEPQRALRGFLRGFGASRLWVTIGKHRLLRSYVIAAL